MIIYCLFIMFLFLKEVDRLAALADLANVQEGRAEPLLQHAEAEVGAGVVQELEQGALVATLERLQDLGCGQIGSTLMGLLQK